MAFASGNSILVVDSDAIICELLQIRLSLGGFQVHTAHDGQEGLKLYDEVTPRLIITDLMLAGMDGYQFIQNIKKKEEESSEEPCKFMVLTGIRLEDDIQRCFELGAAEYMTKPFSPVVLEARIRNLLAN